MKRGGTSLTSNSYNVVLKEKHQVLSTTSRHVNQKIKNKKWCILFFMLLFTCFVLRVKKYYSIPFKSQMEQVVMFPLYSMSCPHCHFSRNHLPNTSTIYPETRLRQIKAITRSEEYYPMPLNDGFTHANLENGYCLKMTIGKARKVYKFYIDTASTLSWLFCNWHQERSQHQVMGPNGLYDPCNGAKIIRRDSHLCFQYRKYADLSSKDVCQLKVHYEDSFRLLSILCEEEVELYNQFGQKLSTIMKLGCGHSVQNKGTYYPSPQTFNYDGMLGMERGPKSIIENFKVNGVIKSSVLVLCLRKEQIVDKSVGFIIFGKPPFLQLIANHLKWAAMVPFGESNSQAYVVRADVIELGIMNTKHTFPNIKFMNILIDCGSAAIFLRKNVLDKIIERIITVGTNLNYKEETIEAEETCLRFPPHGANPQLDFDTLRVGVIGLNGLHYILIYPDQYLRWKGVHSGTSRNYLCVVIEEEDEDSSLPNYFGILGAQAIQDTLFVFDNENNAIGWKSSTCNEVESELTIIENSMYGRPHKRPRYHP